MRAEMDKVKHKDAKREAAMREHRLHSLLEGTKGARKFRDPMALLKG